VQQHQVFVPINDAKERAFEVMRLLMDVQGPRKMYPNLRAKYLRVSNNSVALHPNMYHENIIRILKNLWGMRA
jgi:hypothetical protein